MVTGEGTGPGPADVDRHQVAQWEPIACLLAMTRVESRKAVAHDLVDVLDSNAADARAFFDQVGLDLADPVVQRAAWTALSMVMSTIGLMTLDPRFTAGCSAASSAVLTASTSLLDHVPFAALQAEVEHGDHRRGHR